MQAPQHLGQALRVLRDEPGLPVHEVVGARVGGRGPPVARGEVFEEFYSDAAPRRAQRRDAQARAAHVVQVLLLGAVVLAPARDRHPQYVTVELQTRLGVRDDDGRVVYAEEEAPRRTQPVPLRGALALGEL